MLKDDGNAISSIEKEFILSSLKLSQRTDGRRPFEFRKVQIVQEPLHIVDCCAQGFSPCLLTDLHGVYAWRKAELM